jgi:hypothetical protein
VLLMNLRRRTAYLSILVAMLLMGFVIGYLYTSSNLGTTITTLLHMHIQLQFLIPQPLPRQKYILTLKLLQKPKLLL